MARGIGVELRVDLAHVYVEKTLTTQLKLLNQKGGGGGVVVLGVVVGGGMW